MLGEPDIARQASHFADGARVQILSALTDVDALPASELARRAGLAKSTVSSHLSRLLDAGLLTVEQHGRHRYYALADRQIVTVLETLAGVAPLKPVTSLSAARRSEHLSYARTCYDHLAGFVGVRLTDALVAERTLCPIDGAYEVTSQGDGLLDRLGIDARGSGQRPYARACLDWSERRYHLAGALGAGLTNYLFDRNWIARRDSSRAVVVTDAGREGLAKVFKVELGGDTTVLGAKAG